MSNENLKINLYSQRLIFWIKETINRVLIISLAYIKNIKHLVKIVIWIKNRVKVKRTQQIMSKYKSRKNWGQDG